MINIDDTDKNQYWLKFIFPEKIYKAKIYLKPQEKPPEGREVKRGPKGGLYYESDVSVQRERVSKVKKFPSQLKNYAQPKKLYDSLIASKSIEEKLGLAYDMWKWFKTNKALMSSEEQDIFNNFHRSINGKIRLVLKEKFDRHVGKPKIDTKAVKIKNKLKKEPHEEVKTASEQFIASIISKEMQVKLDLEEIKDWQKEISDLTSLYNFSELGLRFADMSNEKNMRVFLLKSENLLADLDLIDNSEVTKELNWRITQMRTKALKDLDWDKIFHEEIMKDRVDEEYAHKIAQSIRIDNRTSQKIRPKTETEVREMIKKAIMKLSPEVLKRLEHTSIRVVDRPWGYMAAGRGQVEVSRRYFPGRGSAYIDESSFVAGILHEFTHEYEYSNSKFIEAESSIFSRRTRFDNIENSRAWGNKYDTYKDRWREQYMGRLYNSRNFEITSTTLGAMCNSYRLLQSYSEDPEMFIFAKDVMLDGKFEK